MSLVKSFHEDHVDTPHILYGMVIYHFHILRQKKAFLQGPNYIMMM